MKKFIPLCLAVFAVACVDKNPRPIKTKRKVVYDYEQFKALSVDEIKAKIDEDPENPQPYFLLGEHYESTGQLLLALQNYIEGTTRFKNSPGYDPKRKYTGGHFRIGKVYARLSKYNEAIIHLRKVVAMEPKAMKDAVVNYQFREGHYLLGACYKETLDYGKSKYHFERFLKLGGEEWRALPFLAELKKDDKPPAKTPEKW